MSERQPVTLVLLPGMDGTGLLFAPFVQALPEWVKPVVVSYPDDRPLGYEGLLEIVMAALPTSEPFVILGESFSGPLALMAAERHPAGLNGVILCATFVTWPLPLPRLLVETALRAGIFRLKRFRYVQRLLLGSARQDELAELFFAALDRPTSLVLTARGRAVCRVDCREALRRCPVPVLVMEAGGDRIVAPAAVAELSHLRPDTRVRRFDSPHMILQCATEEAVEAICGFVDRPDAVSVDPDTNGPGGRI